MSTDPARPRPSLSVVVPTRGDGRGASYSQLSSHWQLCQHTQARQKERAQTGDVPIELLVQHPVIVFKKDEMEVPAPGNPLTARARMLPPQEYDHAFDGKLPDVHAKGEVRLGFHGQVRLLQVCALAACPHRHLFKLRPHGFRALARLCR
jgi:hypothetical protein